MARSEHESLVDAACDAVAARADAESTHALRAALGAALAAGEIQLGLLGKLGSGEVRSKSARRDLVTEADVRSERHIVEVLRAATPGYAIEAEEETSDARGDAPRWFVDPLDGTVNYVHELPLFSVSVALYRTGPGGETIPDVGVVHGPRLGETFLAVRGAGAFAVRSTVTPDGAPAVVAEGAPGPQVRRLQVSATDSLSDAILATGFPYRRGELEHSNLENFGRFFLDVRGLRRMGSAALDLAFVAAGRLTGFWELHLSPHDVAAGALLVREAGGTVTDADGGEDWLRGGHIVASAPGIAQEIRGRLVH